MGFGIWIGGPIDILFCTMDHFFFSLYNNPFWSSLQQNHFFNKCFHLFNNSIQLHHSLFTQQTRTKKKSYSIQRWVIVIQILEAQRRRFHAKSLEGISKNKKEDYTLLEDVLLCFFVGMTKSSLVQALRILDSNSFSLFMLMIMMLRN